MKFENTEVWGFEHSLRGLRNPLASWERSDSDFDEYFDIVKGDIAPSLSNISDGVITINGCNYEIHTGCRPRNPNGTIHHTEFEIK